MILTGETQSTLRKRRLNTTSLSTGTDVIPSTSVFTCQYHAAMLHNYTLFI